MVLSVRSVSACPDCGGPKDRRSTRCRACSDRLRQSDTCPGCGTKNARFNKRTRSNGTITRRGRCVDCESKSARDWQKKNAERVRQRKREWYSSRPDGYTSRKHLESRLRKMGYSDSEVENVTAWMENHGPECDICGRAASGYRWERLHLDHDETTGQIRGLLCPPCNMSIGKFDHDADRLIKAAAYLVRPSVFAPGSPS